MVSGVEAARLAGAGLEYRDVKPADDEQLLRVHDRGYLDLIRRTSESGGGYLDGDTAVNGRSWDVTRLASGAAVGAVEAAMDGEVSFAVVRPPGHHAGSDYAMGFCLTNHAAVAAAHARSLGAERVAVLDWDVHHGNGTQDIFYGRADVLYLSVHRGGMFYPGTGRLDEVGEGAGAGFTVNIPLRGGSGSAEYGAVFLGVLIPILKEYAPEVLIVSAGYDAHAADPLGGMSLRTGDFGRFAGSLTALCREVGAGPPAFVAEGGYSLESLSQSVAATITGATGGAVDGQTVPEPPVISGKLRDALSPYWRCLRRAVEDKSPS